MIEGLICKDCGTNNGITQYVGKSCKKCGKILVKSMFGDDEE